jgi:hypothetical protein
VKKRVFISHSGIDRINEEDQFFTELHDALQADFNVLDDSGLQPGDDWRHELYAWMGLCDAAVIILSPSAKRVHSTWVPRECMVLCWRQELSPDMLIIPVFYPDFIEADLKGDLYREVGLEKLQRQAVNVTNRLQAIDEIRERLTSLKAGDTPLEITARKIAALLKNVDESTIVRALDELPIDLKITFSDNRLLLGIRLAHFGFSKSQNGKRPAVEALHVATRSLGPEERRKLVELLAPSWIDMCRLRCFHPDPVAGMPRVLALDADESDTAKQHIGRAFIDPFKDPPAIVDLLADSGEHTADEVLKQVAEVYARPHPGMAPKIAKNLLREAGNPVFFCVSQQAAVPVSVLYEVQAKLPRITFIYLSGETPPAHLERDLPQSSFVAPRLKAGEEEEALTGYWAAKARIED